MSKERFAKEVRLCKTPEFRRVFDARHCAADGTLIVFVLPNGLGRCRLGLSVSKKAGCAVVRNRWKRIIREAFRKNQTVFSGSVDIVVVPQKRIAPPSGQVAEKSLVKLITKVINGIQPQLPDAAQSADE